MAETCAVWMPLGKQQLWNTPHCHLRVRSHDCIRMLVVKPLCCHCTRHSLLHHTNVLSVFAIFPSRNTFCFTSSLTPGAETLCCTSHPHSHTLRRLLDVLAEALLFLLTCLPITACRHLRIVFVHVANTLLALATTHNLYAEWHVPRECTVLSCAAYMFQ